MKNKIKKKKKNVTIENKDVNKNDIELFDKNGKLLGKITI